MDRRRRHPQTMVPARIATALTAVVLLTLAAIASPTVSPIAVADETPTPSPAEPAACAVRTGEGRYPNPLHECPAADPGMVIHGRTWYAFTTGLRLYRSTDAGHHWADLGTFLTVPDGYVDTWAPEVYRIGHRWVAYFNMRTAPGQFNKLYVATSDSLERGWTLRPEPTREAVDHSMIDATTFVDIRHGRHQRYLLWKDDYQTREQRRISIAPLSPDGLRVTGPATPILSVTQPWEANSVEAPTMITHRGRYYLFYSGALFTATGGYGVGVARADAPTSSFDAGKHDGPILSGDDRVASPGHQFVTTATLPGVGRRQLIFYHGYPWYDAAGTRLPSPQTRKLMLDQLRWDPDDWPVVNDGHPSR